MVQLNGTFSDDQRRLAKTLGRASLEFARARASVWASPARFISSLLCKITFKIEHIKPVFRTSWHPRCCCVSFFLRHPLLLVPKKKPNIRHHDLVHSTGRPDSLLISPLNSPIGMASGLHVVCCYTAPRARARRCSPGRPPANLGRRCSSSTAQRSSAPTTARARRP
jgi:hypothetical protein